MKQFIFVLLFLSSVVRADSPAPPHPYTTSIYNIVTNLDDYNLTFLICDFATFPHASTHHMTCNEKAWNNENIGTFVGANHLSSRRLLVIPTEVYNQNGNADTLKKYEYPADSEPAIVSKSVFLTTEFHNSEGESFPEDRETRFYSITSVTDGNVTLKLDRRLIYFKDGSTKTITY
jgi:hypothetical protein